MLGREEGRAEVESDEGGGGRSGGVDPFPGEEDVEDGIFFFSCGQIDEAARVEGVARGRWWFRRRCG